MIMCEKKIPAGCIIPDENHDWTAKVPEECIVGTWCTSKLNFGKSNTSNQSHPLVTKL